MPITLFDDKKNCCGCGACINACPQNAIAMAEDEYGFRYPQINANRCVECGLCLKACGYQQNPERREPTACYAAAAKDREVLKRSASGGVFAVLAKEILQRSGVVYGAAMPKEDVGFAPKHVRVERIEDLPMLQGSKYVQSDMALAYRSARQDLLDGKEVLFSGTPCQIAGLRSYLGNEYSNLVTAEVICHGVPNVRMFRDFIACKETKYQKNVCGFSFRSKVKGQGETAALQLRNTHNSVSHRYSNGHQLSYVHYFLKSALCRPSCYSCSFAKKDRVADLTLGDFWGFHQEHPRVKTSHGLSDGRGVSCVLINTEQGAAFLQRCSGNLTLLETRFEKIARHNMQLTRPCKRHPEGDVIMELYRTRGYEAVETHYQNTCKKDRLVHRILDVLPKGIKRWVKRAVGLLKGN